ncbi:unnamed protein product, partial [Effrenium voratum]
FSVKPAAWNAALPVCGSNGRCEGDVESWQLQPQYRDVKLMSLASHVSDGCFGQLPPATFGANTVALLRRAGAALHRRHCAQRLQATALCSSLTTRRCST